MSETSSMQIVAFDLEIAKELPDDGGDWSRHMPLGISCAATLDSDGNLRLWHGSALQADFMRDGYPPQMSPVECRKLAQFLVEMQAEGYTVVTFNGLGFDFPVLAMECGDLISFENLRDLAIDHIDMGFSMLCEKGFMVGLDTAAKGMKLTGKTEGMHGALAPVMWKQGRKAQEQVLEYVAQDVQTTLEVFRAVEKRKALRWKSRSGRINLWGLASGRFTTVREALALPEPDTSWMDKPWQRSKFAGWTENGLPAQQPCQEEGHDKNEEEENVNASELAMQVLVWETKQREADALAEIVKVAVLKGGKTITVGNVRASYSGGRFDYQAVAEAKGIPHIGS